MNKQIKLATGISLLLLGLLMTLDYMSLLELRTNTILSITFMFYGLVVSAITFGSNRNGILFLASSVFLYGVFLYVLESYVIFKSGQLVIPAMLFIFGGGLLSVYLQDFKNTPIIVAALFLISISIFIIETKPFENIYIVERVIRFTKSYWPLMLIIIGLGVLTRRS